MLDFCFQSILVNETTATFSPAAFSGLYGGIFGAGNCDRSDFYVPQYLYQGICCDAGADAGDRADGHHAGQRESGYRRCGDGGVFTGQVPLSAGNGKGDQQYFPGYGSGTCRRYGIYRHRSAFCSGDRCGKYHIHSQQFWGEAQRNGRCALPFRSLWTIQKCLTRYLNNI